MRFTDYASSVLKNNRRLRANAREKYFKSKKKLIPSSAFGDQVNISQESISVANSIKRKSIFKLIVVVLAFSLVGGLLVTRYAGKAMVKYQSSYIERLNEFEGDAIYEEKLSYYHTVIRSGKNHYDLHHWDHARVEFQRALELFPKGKEANIGVTKCLMMNCKLENTYCYEAKEYYESMSTSNLLSDVEKDDLELLLKRIY